MSRLGDALAVLRGTKQASGGTFSEVATLGGGGGSKLRRGTAELLKAYSELPWLRAIVNRVGDAVSSTEWIALRPTIELAAKRAFRLRRGSPPTRAKLIQRMVKAGNLEPLDDHKVLHFLEDGNSLHSGQDVAQVTQALRRRTRLRRWG